MPKLSRIILICLALFATTTTASSQTPTTLSFGVHDNFTRIVLRTTNPVHYKTFSLTAPPRLVIDLPANQVNKISHADNGKGIIKAYRFGLFKHGVSRLVFDMQDNFAIKKLFVINSESDNNSRLVIDIHKTNKTPNYKNASKGWKNYEKILQQNIARFPPRPPKLSQKPLIVIDAGHGGIDPGASHKHSHHEKHLTLKMAQHLKKSLTANGQYNVILTRNSDVYLPLRQRFAIADKNNADLFISLHADASKKSKVSGASVYTLSESASSKEVELLAKRENQADQFAGVNLNDDPQLAHILNDLQQHATEQESVRFAIILVQNMQKNIKLLKNPHRFAGFAVLKSPTVPSVLIEMGFLSNKQEAKKLNSKKFQNQFSKTLKIALKQYFANGDKIATLP